MAEYSMKPWDVPIRKYIETFPIIVLVVDIKGDEDKILHEIRLDYGDSNQRKYLGKITYWALDNGYTIEMMTVALAERDK